MGCRNSRPSGGGSAPSTTDRISIPVELRGITVPQLEEAFAEACERCDSERWVFTSGPHKGERVAPATIDLYTLAERLIKPATAERRCSFVEMKATGPQPPVWFVR
jgi:hypothetical protein